MNKLSFFLLVTVITSCSSNSNEESLINSILLEEYLQKANVQQYDKGQGYYLQIKGELMTTPVNLDSKSKRNKLSHVFSKIEQINTDAARVIKLIEDYKLELIRCSNQSINFGEGNLKTLIWKKYDYKRPCLPLKLNLKALSNPGNSDVSNKFFLNEDFITLSEKSEQLWEELNSFRTSVVRNTGEHSLYSNSFTINVSRINKYTDLKDLENKIVKMFGDKYNYKEDRQLLIDLYIEMTKPEFVKDANGNELHWLAYNLKNMNLIQAIGVLSALENNVLTARALAMAHWVSRIGSCDYPFNKIIAFVNGPTAVNSGQDVELEIMFAAIDTDNQPTVTIDGIGKAEMKVVDGVGKIKFKAPSSAIEMNVCGTISTQLRSGLIKTEKWCKKIKIVQ